MARICVLGLGKMGTRFARVLLREGHAVTVWNRTVSRAVPLAAEGASVAPDTARAVEACEVVLMLLSDHQAVRQLCGDTSFASSMRGRTLIQLTNGSAADTAECAAWALHNEVNCLSASILAVPEMIGTFEATLLCTGDRAVFGANEALLRELGQADYLGDKPEELATLTAALECFVLAALTGFMQGAALARSKGLNADLYTRVALACVPTILTAVKGTPALMQERQYTGDQASVEALVDSARHAEEACAAAGLQLELPDAVLQYYERAAQRFPGKEFQAVVESIASG